MDLLEVGRVVRPHGLRGEVVVELVTNRSERLAPGSTLSSSRGPLEVLRASPYRDRWRVSFSGVSDREGAEALRGAVLSAPPLEEPGALWVHELVGSEVTDQSGRGLGVVTAVQANPASDLLVISGGGLIPLRFVTRSGHGRVEVEIPPGLLE